MSKSLFSEILSESSRGKISGGHRILHWRSSNQLPNTSTNTFWELTTNFRYHRFLLCKQMELFYCGNLSKSELSALFDAPGVLNDNLFFEALRAKNFGVEEKTLQQRLHWLQGLLGRRQWSKNLMYTYLGNLRYELLEVRVPIRQVNKYSGWIRNSSAVGSKSPTRKSFFESETAEVLKDEEKIDIFRFLTVGELNDTSLRVSF